MRIAILGFGHVGRALARLLIEQRGRHPFAVTAIVTQRHGNVTDPRGIDLEQALARETFGGGGPLPVGMLDTDVVVDLTPLDARTGARSFGSSGARSYRRVRSPIGSRKSRGRRSRSTSRCCVTPGCSANAVTARDGSIARAGIASSSCAHTSMRSGAIASAR